WQLSKGEAHATDRTNAGVTGLLQEDARDWDQHTLEVLEIDPEMLPSLVPSLGVIAPAVVLKGAPPIAALCGDQQASLIGQGCVHPGDTKATFGTGAM